MVDKIIKILLFSEALSPAFIHAGADLWPHPLNFANAEQIQQLQQQALLHPALQHQLPVRSFLWLTDVQGNGKILEIKYMIFVVANQLLQGKPSFYRSCIKGSSLQAWNSLLSWIPLKQNQCTLLMFLL